MLKVLTDEELSAQWGKLHSEKIALAQKFKKARDQLDREQRNEIFQTIVGMMALDVEKARREALHVISDIAPRPYILTLDGWVANALSNELKSSLTIIREGMLHLHCIENGTIVDNEIGYVWRPNLDNSFIDDGGVRIDMEAADESFCTSGLLEEFDVRGVDVPEGEVYNRTVEQTNGFPFRVGWAKKKLLFVTLAKLPVAASTPSAPTG